MKNRKINNNNRKERWRMWFGFRDLNWEIFASNVLFVPRAMSSATCKLMSTHHAGLQPKKGQISCFCTL
jgi:hypothetical protein